MNSRIPKRIIQVWGGGEHDLSKFAKAAIANVKLLNHDFEYLFFDDHRIDSFTTEYFPQYRSLFNSFRYNIQKYDFFRYLAIYHFGGFYFDLDMFLYKNLSDLLENSCVFPFERIGINKYTKEQYNMHWDVGNFAFGAAPGHPFIRAIIENCVRAQREPEWAEIMLKSIPWMFRKDAYVICTTGPGVVTRTYAENPHLQSTVKILMPENMYNPRNWTQFGSYGIDISCYVKQSAWRKKKMNKLFKIIWNYYYLKTDNRNIRLAQMANKKPQ
jgi:mannosyltransferase OCH1-like enzyme